MRSPQIEQTPSPIGRMSDRHSTQTGSRKILTRGAPQRRQSEGKSVANKLSATPLTEETNEDTRERLRATTLVPAARIGSPLLLKTNLPRPARARGATSGRICFSIAGGLGPRNAWVANQAAARCVTSVSRSRTGTKPGW